MGAATRLRLQCCSLRPLRSSSLGRSWRLMVVLACNLRSYIEFQMMKSKGKSSHSSVALSNPAKKPSGIQRIAVAIMAAGKGTRLKSQLPKVLHEVGGKPLLEHVIRAAIRIVPATDVFAIIGHEADRVPAAMAHPGINFVLQAEQRGTGHALMVAEQALAGYDHVIVLSGDAPLITPETIASLGDFPRR